MNYINSEFEIGDKHYEGHIRPLEDFEHIVRGYTVLIVDVTSTYEYIKEVTEMREKAEEANRAKSDFLANMSHEIRTPMNAVVGMSELIIEESRGRKMYDYACNIKSAALNLLSIINDILDLSKVEAGKMELVEDEYFVQTISKYSQDPNGLIDNMLLREIYDNNVKFLLTDDNLMLRKAEDLYIRDRVITSSELLKYFESSNPKNVEYKMLAVKLKDFSEIDLNSSFFDTLREDYEGIKFDNWFKKKAKQKEKAYVNYNICFEDTYSVICKPA